MDWIVGGLAATTRERAVPQTDRRRPLRQSPAVPGGRPKAACQALSLLGNASLGSFAVWSGRGTGLISAKLVASVKTLGNQGSLGPSGNQRTGQRLGQHPEERSAHQDVGTTAVAAEGCRSRRTNGRRNDS